VEPPSYRDDRDDRVTVWRGRCEEIMLALEPNSVDAIVTDPPYDLTGSRRGGFMGKQWDATGIAFDPATWEAALRVLKPGGHLVAFGGTRTYHRMACAVEDAGFEIRDCLQWLYGSGYPKSRNQRDIGRPELGTALKPANEPIVLARKPIAERTIARNVVTHGTGGLNIDGCRIALEEALPTYTTPGKGSIGGNGVYNGSTGWYPGAEEPADGSLRHDARGRWPANVVLDEDAAAILDASTLVAASRPSRKGFGLGYHGGNAERGVEGYADAGGASRFFYVAKASQKERRGSTHPTIKPVALMRWLARLITPPAGVILDPFAGSGTTVEAALLEGFRVVAIEQDPEYIPDILRRIAETPQRLPGIV
jgi:site-specific DNA-methyltransferase (adenine-specific)